MDTLIAALPVVFLVWSMTKQHPLAAHVALPLTALFAGLLQVFYFQADKLTLLANAVAGGLSVLTPISIVAGAILLNRVLVISGAENTLKQWLESISRNQVAQLMIIGWAFAFMLEGASGFGTPAAIAAPILVGLGFNPMRVALLTLVMNSVPVSFGAVGTPAWFGFAALELSEAQLLATSQWTALIHLVASLIIPALALRFLVSWKAIRDNGIFVVMSALSCTAPYYLLAQVNYEFPSLIGGAVGLCLTILAAKFHIGLARQSDINDLKEASLNPVEVFKALSPFLLLIAILIVTRIKQWPFKGWLNDTSLWFSIGDFGVSQALILSWSNIFGTTVAWSYKTLYVPAIIPFVVTVILLVPVLALTKCQLQQATSDTWQRIKLPALALVGALMMVNFMMQGDDNAPIFIIANTLADTMGANWSYVASLLGALGSFFSGSATVSNLTFGGIQHSIALQTSLPVTVVLALQSVGASMGNMICLNNIIAVCSILGIKNQEGAMIKRTILPMLVYALVAALMGQVILRVLL